MHTQKLTLALLGLLSLALLGNVAKAADEQPAETSPAPAAAEKPLSDPAAAEKPLPDPAAAEKPLPAPAAAEKPLPDPVALVNGEPVSKAQYEIYAAQRAKQGVDAQSPGARQALTEEMVIQELLVQAAQKEGLDKDPQLAIRLELARRGLLAQNLIEKMLAGQAPTDEDVKKEYDTLAAAIDTKEYKASHILVESEDQAKEIVGELQGGADFAELAKAHSTDGSKANGGELGWFSPNMMVPEFSQAAGKLEKGKFTEQPVKTQFGWHVILLEDIRDAAPPALDDVRPQIVQRLQGLAFEAYLARLREGAEIDIK